LLLRRCSEHPESVERGVSHEHSGRLVSAARWSAPVLGRYAVDRGCHAGCDHDEPSDGAIASGCGVIAHGCGDVADGCGVIASGWGVIAHGWGDVAHGWGDVAHG